MGPGSLPIRKISVTIDETYSASGVSDEGGVLRKVAVAAVVTNPLAGQGFVEDLSVIVNASSEIGTMLGERAAQLLAAPVESYGKAGMVGSAGEQEHVNAALTSVFGNAFRDAIGGGAAWISSVTKAAGIGASIDVPLAYKDEIWVRSHYDAQTLCVADAPRPDEMVIIAVVSNRGRINARVGGMTVDEAKARAS